MNTPRVMTVKRKVALTLIFSLLVLSQVLLKHQKRNDGKKLVEKENETLKSDGQQELPAHPFQDDEYPEIDKSKVPFRSNYTKIEASKSGAATADLKNNQTKFFNSDNITSSSNTSTAINRVNISFALAGFKRCGISLLTTKTARIPQVFFGSGGSNEQSTSTKVTDEAQLLKNGNIHEFERNYQGGSDVSSIAVNAFKSSQLMCSDNGLDNFAQYFPETNLVVAVRHPVLQFQSQYNFFYRHVENDGDLPKPSLFQGCQSFHFHRWLSRLSLTPSETQEESDLLLHHHKPSYHPNWKGKLFIMQYEQLVDANATRRNAMEREYENFIGVPSLSFDSTSSSSKIGTRRNLIDICHTKHTAFRYRVIEEAENAALWIKNYLLESEKVVVPNKNHFLKILDGWSVDPCIQTMDQLATSRYRVESFANVSRNPEKISMIVERSIRNETDLIDFAIAGFAKCGTTTLMKTTSAVEQVYMGNLVGKPVEVQDIRKDDMTTFRKRYKDHQRYVSDGGLRLLNGFKSPGILENQSYLTNLFNHYPSIDLVVSVRHPILHFQSGYNYFYRNVNRTTTILPNPIDLIGNCGYGYCSHNCTVTVENTNAMCTQRSYFHYGLSRLHLTTLQTEKEKVLLDHHRLSIHPSWNGRLFLMEIGQLADSNITRKNDWDRSYEQFLGIKTGTFNSSILGEKRVREKIIHICDDAHKPVREVLLEVGRKASQWIQDYLVHSDRVFIENQDHFLSLVEQWKYDPCLL